MVIRLVASYLMVSTNTSALNFADREFLLNRKHMQGLIRSFVIIFVTGTHISTVEALKTEFWIAPAVKSHERPYQ
jgi:hypothetical protein